MRVGDDFLLVLKILQAKGIDTVHVNYNEDKGINVISMSATTMRGNTMNIYVELSKYNELTVDKYPVFNLYRTLNNIYSARKKLYTKKNTENFEEVSKHYLHDVNLEIVQDPKRGWMKSLRVSHEKNGATHTSVMSMIKFSKIEPLGKYLNVKCLTQIMLNVDINEVKNLMKDNPSNYFDIFISPKGEFRCIRFIHKDSDSEYSEYAVGDYAGLPSIRYRTEMLNNIGAMKNLELYINVEKDETAQKATYPLTLLTYITENNPLILFSNNEIPKQD